MNTAARIIKLPLPSCDGKLPVEGALLARRSTRNYSEQTVDLREISQLLWAAQGVTRAGGYRTCPSAGALYPLELQLVAGKVEGLAAGVYRYESMNHALAMEAERDIRQDLSDAALGQTMILRAPATIAISCVFERTTRKYGERGVRYVHMEAGNASQNIQLQAVSLKLGSVIVGAFRDDRVKRVLDLQPDEDPLLLVPVGK